MAGTISTLGIGSGIDLQGMLEQLREIDQEVVDRKETKITELEAQLDEFTNVNNKLISMKSSALNLSLEGSFIGRNVSSSDESVASATVLDGVAVQNVSLDVSQLATKSSWMSTSGFAESTASVYVPVSQESTVGVADPAVDIVAHAGESMTIAYGDAGAEFVLNIGADMTMDELVEAVNSHAGNVNVDVGDNDRLVTAETYVLGGDTFFRVKSDVVGGSGESNRVKVTEDLVGLDLSAPEMSLFYKIGDGDTITVSVRADTTMEQLATQINEASDNPGVTASVINDGDATAPYRFSMKANGTGENNRITFLSQLNDMALGEEGGAGGASLNAMFSVDGINYQRQENSVTDVIAGVSLTLEGSGTSTIDVSANNEQVKEMILGFVDAYNEAVLTIREDTAYDAKTGAFAILSGTTVRDLPYELQGLVTSTVDGYGSVTSLFDLGLEVNRDGTISLDEEVLDLAISEDASGVSTFFVGDSDNEIEGFADKINTRLRSLTAGNGQISAEKNAAQARISDLQLKIEQENARLDKKYDVMTREFIQLDRYMNEMTSLSNYLTSTFDSLSNGWGE